MGSSPDVVGRACRGPSPGERSRPALLDMQSGHPAHRRARVGAVSRISLFLDIIMSVRDIPRLKAEFFKALGHPTRIRALELLSEGEHSVSALAGAMELEQPALSGQLAILRRAGLVTARRDGPNVMYALADDRIADLLAVSRQILLDMVSEAREALRAS